MAALMLVHAKLVKFYDSAEKQDVKKASLLPNTGSEGLMRRCIVLPWPCVAVRNLSGSKLVEDTHRMS